MSAAAWTALCDRLVALAERLGGDRFPQDDRGRAEAHRHLARQLVIALQGELEHADPRHPTFHRYEEPWTQWGGPNPDNVYLRAAVDPAATYRVSGDVAGVRAAIFSLCDGDMHLGKYGVFSERTLDTLALDGDRVDIVISPDEHAGNWMPMHPEARLLLVRQYQCDWERDRIATLRIERADTAGVPPPPPTTTAVDAALRRAADWVEASIGYWCEYVERARAALVPNTFGPPATPRGGAPNIAYGSGWWKLEPGQALLVASEWPDADYWGWTVHHRYFLDSGDFARRQTSLNLAQAHRDADGRVRFVVAPDDPGAPNWIDTEGRAEGLLVYRYVGARTRPVPEGEVVPATAVRDRLPPDHPVVTPEQRRIALARRAAAVLARYS